MHSSVSGSASSIYHVCSPIKIMIWLWMVTNVHIESAPHYTIVCVPSSLRIWEFPDLDSRRELELILVTRCNTWVNLVDGASLVNTTKFGNGPLESEWRMYRLVFDHRGILTGGAELLVLSTFRHPHLVTASNGNIESFLNRVPCLRSSSTLALPKSLSISYTSQPIGLIAMAIVTV